MSESDARVVQLGGARTKGFWAGGAAVVIGAPLLFFGLPTVAAVIFGLGTAAVLSVSIHIVEDPKVVATQARTDAYAAIAEKLTMHPSELTSSFVAEQLAAAGLDARVAEPVLRAMFVEYAASRSEQTTDEAAYELAQAAQALSVMDLPVAIVDALIVSQLDHGAASPDALEDIRRKVNARGLTWASSHDDQVKRAAMLWSAMQGLGGIEVDIRLQAGERCLVSMAGELIETRTVTTGVSYAGPSLRLNTGVPGLSYRMGSFGVSHATSEVDKVLDSGTLYVTNKRLLFEAHTKTWTLPYTKLLTWTVFDNGLHVEKEAGRHQFFALDFSDPELLNAVLIGATRAA